MKKAKKSGEKPERAIKPERLNANSYFLGLDKLSRNMVENLNAAMKSGNVHKLDIGNQRKDKGQAYIRYAVQAQKFNKKNGVTVEGLNDISEADVFLHDILCSLYEAGNRVLTFNQIYQTMKGTGGKTKYARISKGQRENMDRRISNMMAHLIIIDNSEAAARYNNYLACKLKTPMIPAKIYEEGLCGKEVFLVFLDEPPLITLAKSMKQYSGIPIKVIQAIPGNLLTDGTAARVRYLLDRIARIRGKGTILWTTLYNALKIKTNDMARERKKVIACLEAFKVENLIQEFEGDKQKIFILKGGGESSKK